jgi:hypothetical protein
MEAVHGRFFAPLPSPAPSQRPALADPEDARSQATKAHQGVLTLLISRRKICPAERIIPQAILNQFLV